MMDNNFLKRKLNPFLLITTVMVLAILAGASVIYQQELGELVGTRENLSTQLENTEAELEQAKQNISELRETRDSLQTEVSGVETDLENLRTSTDREISNLESNLSEVRNERDNLRRDLNDTKTTLENVRESRDEMRLDFELVCAEANLTETAEDRCDIYFAID
mgnify:CR=1 FL=1